VPHRLRLVAALAATLVIAAPVAAGQPVVGQLNPEPPDFYTCSATGGGTICRAQTSDAYDVPSGIWCGTGADAFEVQDTAGHTVRATRWYDTDGNLVRRERVGDFPGAHLSNPSTGASVAYQQHNIDWDVLAVPGDLSSSTWSGHGVLSMTAPGYGRVILEAGVIKVAPGDNVEHQAGPSDLGDYFGGDATAVAKLCAALAED
jgi:hypothetical protein